MRTMKASSREAELRGATALRKAAASKRNRDGHDDGLFFTLDQKYGRLIASPS